MNVVKTEVVQLHSTQSNMHATTHSCSRKCLGGLFFFFFYTSAHKGSCRMEPAPLSLSCVLISSCLHVRSGSVSNPPLLQQLLQWPLHACTFTHMSVLPQQQESSHQRLKTPTPLHKAAPDHMSYQT